MHWLRREPRKRARTLPSAIKDLVTFISDDGVPATVFPVAQQAVEQAVNAVLGHGASAGAAHEVSGGEGVHHTRGDPELDTLFLAESAGITDPAEAVADLSKTSKLENTVEFGFEPTGVRWQSDPVHITGPFTTLC